MLPLTIARNIKASTARPRLQISAVGTAVLLICVIVGVAPAIRYNNPLPVIAGIVIGFYFLFAIRVAEQWQKAAVLRLGRYIGLRGPGIFFIIPVIDEISVYVDQRVRVVEVSAESALTRDTVPVNVDAIVFWMVWNAEKSILEVVNFSDAILMSAQTALRESIGRHDLAQMITEREMLGRELQRILDEKTNPGASPCSRSKFATCTSRRRSKTPCRGRPRPSANGRPASSWARPRPTSPPNSPTRPWCTSTTRWRCICAR